jgi:hypothetical protein
MVQLPSKLCAATRQLLASEDGTVSVNDLADALKKSRAQLEDDYRGNVRLLRQRFGEDMVDAAMAEARRRLVR